MDFLFVKHRQNEGYYFMLPSSKCQAQKEDYFHARYMLPTNTLGMGQLRHFPYAL